MITRRRNRPVPGSAGGAGGAGRTCPVRLVHGCRDVDVPWRRSLRLAARPRSSDVAVAVAGDGDRRLSRDENLARLARTLHDVPG